MTLKLRWAFILSILCLALSPKVFAQAIDVPSVSPAAVNIGSATTISVRTAIPGTPIATSVNVQRVLDDGSVVVLGSLNDNGADGDDVAGDGIYSGRVSVLGSIEGVFQLRISAAYPGVLRRSLSPSYKLSILPIEAPKVGAILDFSDPVLDIDTGAEIVRNEVDACFQDRATYSQVLSAASAIAASVVGRLSENGNCYQFMLLGPSDAARVKAAIALMRSNPIVIEAKPQYIGTLQDACSGPTCSDPNYSRVLDLDAVHNFITEGAGTIVGAVDSGLDYNSIVISSPGEIRGSHFAVSPATNTPLDGIGHGTAVLSIIKATAPKAKIYYSKVCSLSKKCPEESLRLGIEEAKRTGVKVLNVSIGFPVNISSVEKAIANARNSMLIVAAAGNDGANLTRCPAGTLECAKNYPAAYSAAGGNVIAVGNTDAFDRRWDGSPNATTSGSWLDIAAPGVDILAYGTNAQVSGWYGTSFSAPFVTGTAALVLSKFPSLSPAKLREHLISSALPIPRLIPQLNCAVPPCDQLVGKGRIAPVAASGGLRFTRNTAINAGSIQTATVSLIGSGQSPAFITTGGQRDGCQNSLVAPTAPCIVDLPFDFAALPPGTYTLFISNTTSGSASMFATVELFAPNTQFVSPVSGGGSIDSANPKKASLSLFTFSTRSASLTVIKR